MREKEIKEKTCPHSAEYVEIGGDVLPGILQTREKKSRTEKGKHSSSPCRQHGSQRMGQTPASRDLRAASEALKKETKKRANSVPRKTVRRRVCKRQKS